MTELRVLLAALLLCATGCSSKRTATVAGTVKSTNGTPIANASIVSVRGAGSTVSSSTGTFSLTVNDSLFGDFSQGLAFNVTAPAFAPQLAMLPFKPGVGSYLLPIAMVPITAQTVASGQVTTMNLTVMGRSATLTIPPISGSGLEVHVAPIDAANAPGALHSEGTGPDQALQSNGMIFLEVVDAQGNRVAAPSGIQINLADNAPSAVAGADQFQGYQLGGDGQWNSPTPFAGGAGARHHAAVSATVPDFGYWNADRNFKTACVKGKIAASAGACQGAAVKATGPDGISSNDSSGGDGSFCVTGAQTFPSSISVGGGGTTSVTMPANAGNCSAPETCKDVGTITVPPDACPAVAADAGTNPPGCFQCAGGPCISPTLVCNGSPDCPGGEDEAVSLCSNQGSCCVATADCPGETGSSCAATCCCCPAGQRCCPDPTQGCCNSP